MTLQEGGPSCIILEVRVRTQLRSGRPSLLRQAHDHLPTLHEHSEEALAHEDIEKFSVPMVPRPESIAHHLGLNAQALMILKLHFTGGTAFGGERSLQHDGVAEEEVELGLPHSSMSACAARLTASCEHSAADDQH